MGNSQIRAPRLEGLFGRPVPLANGKVVKADEGYIRDSILLPQADVAAGYEPLMPTFAGRLSEEEVVELIAYIKSLGTK
jgi:cytochrome c oxidase subunit 2